MDESRGIKRKVMIFIVAFALMLICVSPLLAASSRAEGRETIEIVDARGERVVFDSPPDKIVSFMASNTEMLYYMGLGEKIVGVDDYSNYPPEVEKLPKVGNDNQVDYESIVNLSADVVVITKGNLNMIEPLEEYGQRVVVTSATTVDDIYEDMKMLGKMCGISEEAEDMASELENEMEEVTSITSDIPYDERPDVLYITSTYQGIWTSANDTFQNTILSDAGLDNIASEKSGWTTISEEKIIEKDPDVIVAVNSTKDPVMEMTEKGSWTDISAVKNDEIHFVDDDVVSRPGPRVVEAQKELANITANLKDLEDEDETVPGFGSSMLLGIVGISALVYKKKKYRSHENI